MRLVFASDTHGKHNKIEYPEGDAIFFTGDLSKRGKLWEIAEFAKFLSSLKYRHKVVIAGNHDFAFDSDFDPKSALKAEEMIRDSNALYLNDSGGNIEGIQIWGSPVQPEFNDWAFNRKEGDDIEKHWNKIPEQTQILLTHGPPYEILDTLYDGTPVGCSSLLKKVQEIAPKIHAFGHIHEAYGQKKVGETLYVNASCLDIYYKAHNPCHVIDWIF